MTERHRALVTAPFRGPGLDKLRSIADVVLDPWIDHQPLRLYNADDLAARVEAEGADLLIYDAQYLPEEYEARRRGWGHSHWREAVNVVMESGAKELILYHHDPDHTDALVDKVVTDARSYYPKVRAAAEGMEIEL